MQLHYSNVTFGQHDTTLDYAEEVGGFKVRYKVRANFYEFQSWAKAEVWSPATLSWNEVATVAASSWWQAGATVNEEVGRDCVDDALVELQARVRATLG